MFVEFTSVFDGAFKESEIDKSNNIIRNVALVGQISKNGRRYTKEALSNGVSKYEGAKIFIDHPGPEDVKRGFRSTRDLAGKIENARFDGSKIRGDLKLLKSGGGAIAYEIASDFPEIAGMSHNAFGKCTNNSGEEIVEAIDKVVSVDVVAEPATNEGFFENIYKKIDQTKEPEMIEYSKVTMLGIKESRTDLVEKLHNEGKKMCEAEIQKLQGEKKAIEDEKKVLESKLDELKVKEQLAETSKLVDKMLEESELPEAAKTELFKENLNSLVAGKGEKLEDKIQEQIDDRMEAISPKGVKNNGPRNKSMKESKKDMSAKDIANELK